MHKQKRYIIKRVVITGAYDVIGTAISEMMAEKGYSPVLVGRDPSKVDKVCRQVKEATGNEDVSGYAVDLSREKEIEAFAQNLPGPVHVLINNVGTNR
ncbi:MAG: SDR family NAD(P)-dependent oxidoreductase [Bacteroidales bacterium]